MITFTLLACQRGPQALGSAPPSRSVQRPALPLVTTVLGDIDSVELGPCSIHEHVLCDMRMYLARLDRPPTDEPITLANLSAVRSDHGRFVDNLMLDSVDTMRAEVASFAAVGGKALVEVSVPGARLDVGALREISATTGVHIVPSTGLYVQDSWPAEFLEYSEAQMYAFLMSEIEVGIADTGIRAGHIGELGVSDLARPQRHLLAAAVRASADSGLAVSIHISDPRDPSSVSGVEVARFLLAAGCDPTRTLINHVDYSMIDPRLKSRVGDGNGRSPDYAYARAILDMGFHVSIDSFGWEHYNTVPMWTPIHDWERLEIVRQLVADGYGDRVMLATDTVVKHLTSAYGGGGYRHLLAFVEPGLREIGVAESAIEQMLVQNPACLLARRGS